MEINQLKNNRTLQNDMTTTSEQHTAFPVQEIEAAYIAQENTEGRALDEFEWKMHEYATDPDIRELITAIAADRGLDIPDMSDPDLDEDAFMAAAQIALDSRKGQGREAIVDAPYSERSQAALDSVKEKLAMNHNSEPSRHDFDIALVPGSAGKSPRNRLNYLLKLMEEGKVNTDTIALLGSERPVNMKPLANGTTELDRAGENGYDISGNPAATEFDILRNSAAHALNIRDDEWQSVTGNDPNIPEQHHYQHAYRIAYAEKDGKQIFVLSAPMIDEDRLYPTGNRRTRSNTKDTVRMTAEMLRDHMQDGRELNAAVVTDAVFAKFQEADFASVLAESGVRVEAAGFSRAEAGAADWPGGNNYYAQELLSALRQTRAARDQLLQNS